MQSSQRHLAVQNIVPGFEYRRPETGNYFTQLRIYLHADQRCHPGMYSMGDSTPARLLKDLYDMECSGR